MNPIQYFDKAVPGIRLEVKDSTLTDHVEFSICGESVSLNLVQADKLRQQLHGWLHERANGEDGPNWVEILP